MHLSEICATEVTGIGVVQVSGFPPALVTAVTLPLLCSLRATAAPAGQQ